MRTNGRRHRPQGGPPTGQRTYGSKPLPAKVMRHWNRPQGWPPTGQLTCGSEPPLAKPSPRHCLPWRTPTASPPPSPWRSWRVFCADLWAPFFASGCRCIWTRPRRAGWTRSCLVWAGWTITACSVRRSTRRPRNSRPKPSRRTPRPWCSACAPQAPCRWPGWASSKPGSCSRCCKPCCWQV